MFGRWISYAGFTPCLISTSSLMRAGIYPGGLGNFRRKAQVHVLARATANIESTWAGGSQAISFVLIS